VAVPFLGKSFSEAVLKNPSWLVNISGRTILRATSIFPDPHMFSFYLGMLLPVALILFIKSKAQKYFVSFIILGVADALAFSRGGYLGILAGLIFLGIFFWQKLGVRYKIASTLLFILIAATFLVPGPISERFFSSFNTREGSNQGRLETWKQAIEVIERHPVMGVGIGNYPLEIKPSAGYREPIYAHNTYFDIAAETGILNALVWLALLVWAIVSFIKKSKKNIVNLALASSLVMFSVHSLVETAIYSPVVLTLLAVILGLSDEDKNIDEKSI
jgi:O-antigen ligase